MASPVAIPNSAQLSPLQPERTRRRTQRRKSCLPQRASRSALRAKQTPPPAAQPSFKFEATSQSAFRPNLPASQQALCRPLRQLSPEREVPASPSPGASMVSPAAISPSAPSSRRPLMRQPTPRLPLSPPCQLSASLPLALPIRQVPIPPASRSLAPLPVHCLQQQPASRSAQCKFSLLLSAFLPEPRSRGTSMASRAAIHRSARSLHQIRIHPSPPTLLRPPSPRQIL